MAGDQPNRDLYDVLGVTPDASPAQVTGAYRRLVRDLHPDSGPGAGADTTRLGEVLAAYEVLRDRDRRATYDADRRRHRRSSPGVPISVRHVERDAAAPEGLLLGVGPVRIDGRPTPGARSVSGPAPARAVDLLDAVEVLLRCWW